MRIKRLNGPRRRQARRGLLFCTQFPRWNQRDVAYQSVYLSRCGRKSQARTLINEMVVGGTEERPLSF